METLQRGGYLMLGLVLAFPLMAQTDTVDTESPVQEAVETHAEAKAMIAHSNGKYGSGSKLGVYLKDLDFKDAYERHYPYNYGVMVSGIVDGGNADRAGLVKGDIIMEFDGEKVRYEDHLIQLRDTKAVGETVEVKYFRNERIMTSPFTFYPEPPEGKKPEGMTFKDTKRHLSPGFGGGGPIAYAVQHDFTPINNLLEANGFDPIQEPVIFWGGYGMGNTGKGLFMGGGGAGWEQSQQVPVKNDSGTTIGHKRYAINAGFGGFQLAKKYALFTERLVLDFGLLLGGGGMELKLSQTDGNFSWDPADAVIEDMNSRSVTYSKGYLVYQPSIGLMYRVTDWFGVMGSVGWFGSWSGTDEWKDADFDFKVAGDSPTLFNDPYASIGIWFGH